MRDGSLELIQLCLERVRRCTSLAAESDYRPADLLKLRRYCRGTVSHGLRLRTWLLDARAVVVPAIAGGVLMLGVMVAIVACLDVAFRRATGGVVVAAESAWGSERSLWLPARRGAEASSSRLPLRRHHSSLGYF